MKNLLARFLITLCALTFLFSSSKKLNASVDFKGGISVFAHQKYALPMFIGGALVVVVADIMVPYAYGEEHYNTENVNNWLAFTELGSAMFAWAMGEAFVASGSGTLPRLTMLGAYSLGIFFAVRFGARQIIRDHCPLPEDNLALNGSLAVAANTSSTTTSTAELLVVDDFYGDEDEDDITCRDLLPIGGAISVASQAVRGGLFLLFGYFAGELSMPY